MVAFEIRARFGAFRDPFTISQHLTLPFPPKSAVAGLLAAILGETDYLEDRRYRDFTYSVIVRNPVRRKSFSQNYINDYTQKSKARLTELSKKEWEKVAEGFRDKKNPQKPINRELLIEPKYLIFIESFFAEKQLERYLQEKRSAFFPYMGNSEFAAALDFVTISQCNIIDGEIAIDSFIKGEEKNAIIFEEDVRYTPLKMSTALDKQRKALTYAEVVYADRPIRLKQTRAMEMMTDRGIFRCHMI